MNRIEEAILQAEESAALALGQVICNYVHSSDDVPNESGWMAPFYTVRSKEGCRCGARL